MKKWSFSDCSVMISLKGYAYSITAIFVISLFGGIVMIGTLHGKIEEVDVSNIMMTIWVIGGFCIILAKSWLVKDWSWHGFMHGKLECHSVHELAAATGMNHQTVLGYLLIHDKPIFRTSGPYNSLFLNSESSGASSFAIDKACKLSTLLSCGFTILGVNTPDGTYLVCLGKRRKSALFNNNSNEERLVCKVPSSLKENENPVLRFKKQVFNWDKGFGLYINERDFLFG